MEEHSMTKRRARRRSAKKRKARLTVMFTVFITLLFGAVILEHSGIMSRKEIGTTQRKSETEITEAQVQVPDEVKNTLQNAKSLKHSDLLRKFPFPYAAMLAISSDIDMSTLEEFEEYHRFLNTKEQTPQGEGLGLDIGDSAWLYIANDTSEKVDKEGHPVVDSMSYFQGINPNQLKDGEKIAHYFKSGWIDSLHSFGDFSRNDHSIKFTRDLGVASWKAMNESGFKPEIWINHGSESNVQNFGAYNPKNMFKYQAGDNPKSPNYHTDLTLSNGIRYVWNSLGSNQFSFDDPLFPIHLRDGRKVWGFQRYTNEYTKGKIVWTWETHEISKQITKPRLDQLVHEGKFSIVAQHLGKGSDGFPFTQEGIQALRLLKAYNDNGGILVARTSRLLDYARSHKYVRYAVAEFEGKTYINIKNIEDPVLGSSIPTLEEIRGITFYVDHPESTYLLLNMKIINADEIQRNGQDNTDKKSIGIKWFKPNYADWTKATSS